MKEIEMFIYRAKLDTSDLKRQHEYIRCEKHLIRVLTMNFNSQFKVYAVIAGKPIIELCIECKNEAKN